ncbi:hypothetical protein [Occallatibacter riparius]|uniref:Uncharacterized protein n=1 Tax=Occallatibacter riparius TaxID=1002689 RepID=A0A9J7BJV5_9BACT|nr:hypothetical protein [Occallatibacter riparius]UWZ82827.1 hypothetical protein MOP44_19935 [Occallatibacter riparius]
MQLRQDDNKLSGSFEGGRGGAPLTGSLSGNHVSFTVKMPRRKVEFTGTVEGDKMTGSTKEGGSWTATRQ